MPLICNLIADVTTIGLVSTPVRHRTWYAGSLGTYAPRLPLLPRAARRRDLDAVWQRADPGDAALLVLGCGLSPAPRTPVPSAFRLFSSSSGSSTGRQSTGRNPLSRSPVGRRPAVGGMSRNKPGFRPGMPCLTWTLSASSPFVV